jgi:hypothetical protein
MLRDALLKKGVVVNKAVHLVVGGGKTEEFRFTNAARGTGRKGNAEKPQYTIEAYHSPPLEKTTDKPTEFFQAEIVLSFEESRHLGTTHNQKETHGALAKIFMPSDSTVYV